MKRFALHIEGRRKWIISSAVLIITAGAFAITHYAPATSAAPRPQLFFRTLPPGVTLPSGAQCASWVRASPDPENRPANTAFNHTIGQHVGSEFFPPGDNPQVKRLTSRINGDFTGTTEEILRWAACKWGINQDVVFAQAAVESWWQQDELGDWTTDPEVCPPGRGLGVEGTPGECAQSYGIVQNKYPFEETSWPAMERSTAMNVDAAYAIWRSCYDGYEIWLNSEPKGQEYHAGNLWGCVGRWFAGSWYTPAADTYIREVQEYLDQRIWESPSFKQVA
jgi:hypothetical protein